MLPACVRRRQICVYFKAFSRLCTYVLRNAEVHRVKILTELGRTVAVLALKILDVGIFPDAVVQRAGIAAGHPQHRTVRIRIIGNSRPVRRRHNFNACVFLRQHAPELRRRHIPIKRNFAVGYDRSLGRALQLRLRIHIIRALGRP